MRTDTFTRSNIGWIITILTGATQFINIYGTVTIKIRLVAYATNGRDWDNAKCDTGFTFNKACDPKFTLCMDKNDGDDSFSSCHYVRYQTGYYQGENNVDFNTGTLAGGSVVNPIGGSFQEYLGLKFKVEVYDDDSGHSGHDLMDRLYHFDTTRPARSAALAAWRDADMWGIRTSSTKTNLKISILVYCDVNFYGPACNVYCVAADTDQLGHYTCDPDTGAIVCRPGWETVAEKCKVKQNDCENHQCQNGAACVDHYQYYTCDCQPGFIGDKCGVNIDECASDPCLNNGTCTDGSNAFTCDCQPQHTGDVCQHHVCDVTDLCLNGGTCFEDNGNVSCICHVQYTGMHCDVDKCQVLKCQNGGSCMGGTCRCPENYIGSVCDIDLCDHIHCTNGGSCVGGQCTCSKGYTGQYCHVNINECVSNPCIHSGTCEDKVDGYACRCLPGFNGTHCENTLPNNWNNTYLQRQGGTDTTSNEGGPRWVTGLVVAVVVLIVIITILIVILRKKRHLKGTNERVIEVVVTGEGLDHFSNPLYNDSGEISAISTNIPMPQTKEYPPDYVDNMAAPPPYSLHPTTPDGLVYSETGELIKQSLTPNDDVVEVQGHSNVNDLCGAVGGVSHTPDSGLYTDISADNTSLKKSHDLELVDENTSHYDSPKNIKMMLNRDLPPEEWTPVKKTVIGAQNMGFCDDDDNNDVSIQVDGKVTYNSQDKSDNENCDTNITEENPYTTVAEVDNSMHNNDTNERLEKENSVDESDV